jgi:hypothetical protein
VELQTDIVLDQLIESTPTESEDMTKTDVPSFMYSFEALGLLGVTIIRPNLYIDMRVGPLKILDKTFSSREID